MRITLSLLSILSMAACTQSGDDDAASTSVAGQGVYRDATTDHDGNAQAPSSPPAQTAQLDIVVEGQGTIPDPDPQCALDPAGQFQALYTGTATFDSDGAYVAALAESSGAITTPSGCAIPDLTVGAITDVKVRVTLEATTENCQTYCEASARADAESQCGASADQASCRAAAEADAAASCQTTCTQSSTGIVAEVSLGASALETLTASELEGAALGDVSADLTFDTME